MKKRFLIILILFLPTYLVFPQSLKIEKTIDLSYFLKPHQPHLVFAATDFQGNIFITQRGKDSFIKLDATGKMILTGPQRIEGEITTFDIDKDGNPMCLFPGMEDGSLFFLPLVWFDGTSGKKTKEINLGETFYFVAHLIVLGQNNVILVNGITRSDDLRDYSLHLVDFNGTRIRSFSPLRKRGDTTETIKDNQDYFAYRPRFDLTNMTIFQGLPSIGQIQYFDYSGNRVGETEWTNRETFLTHSGNLWIKRDEGFQELKKEGPRFIPTEVIITDDKKAPIPWYYLTSDLWGKLYFLGGQEFQTLIVYAPK
jgi:hypothetical protein